MDVTTPCTEQESRADPNPKSSRPPIIQLVNCVGLTPMLLLDEKPFSHVNKEALLSEAALAEDWDRPEENEAWKYLQKDQ